MTYFKYICVIFIFLLLCIICWSQQQKLEQNHLRIIEQYKNIRGILRYKVIALSYGWDTPERMSDELYRQEVVPYSLRSKYSTNSTDQAALHSHKLIQ